MSKYRIAIQRYDDFTNKPVEFANIIVHSKCKIAGFKKKIVDKCGFDEELKMEL